MRSNGNTAQGTRVRKRARAFDSVDFVVFLLPFLQFIVLKVVGVLNGGDIGLLLAFLYLAVNGKIRIATRAGKTFIVLGLLWLFSQIVTDIVRHTAFRDYARGWSIIALTLINFAALMTLLYGRPRRLLIYGWGLVVGGILAYFISPDKLMIDYPWKFGFAYPVSLAVLLFVSRKDFFGPVQIALITITGAFDLYMGTRDYGACCLAAAFYLLATRFFHRRGLEGANPRTLLAIAVSILAGSAGVLWAYEYAASTGKLGLAAREKYEEQAAGKYGVLLGGRVELLGEIPAILDSPILGHGSWARDPFYQLLERQALIRLGYRSLASNDINPPSLREGEIPSHSYIFGAWVHAGILGAVFWTWVLLFTGSTLLRVYPANVTLLPLAAFVALLMMWNILFSPVGLTSRIVDPYYVVLLMTCREIARKRIAPVAAIAARGRRGPFQPSLKAT